ncbi:MAG: hypothetical protein EA384_01215 [Spirochaetaceae bacterium]|nr:MAG: hypothetical protein EA384_01215 [Spirochaetaceae bacterium]
MAVKTITIDMEAYGLLAAARRGNESFSTVIKETFAPASHTAAALLRCMADWQPSDALIAAMDQVLADRENNLLVAEVAPEYLQGERD